MKRLRAPRNESVNRLDKSCTALVTKKALLGGLPRMRMPTKIPHLEKAFA